MTPTEANNRLWIARVVCQAVLTQSALHLNYDGERWHISEEPTMHSLTLPVFAIGLLAACIPAAVGQPPNISATANATAHTVAVATATATATATADPMAEYRTQIERQYSAWRRDFEELGSLSAMTTAGSAVIFNNEWQRRTAAVITSIAATNNTVRAISAPPSAQLAHQSFIDAANHFDRALGHYATAINTLDPAGMAAVTPELDAGMAALQNAIDALQ